MAHLGPTNVRQSAASPSISLEKGAYRLRAPASRMTASQSRSSMGKRHVLSGPSQLGTHETQLAILIVLLALATVSSFGAAYYLYTTRWASQAIESPLGNTSDSSPQVAHYDLHSGFDLDTYDQYVHVDDGARFFSYLPHSGFHNQRIAFENALVLSHMLNRTLLVPPVRLGNRPLHYTAFEKLRQMAVSASFNKGELHYCVEVSSQSLPPVECYDYFEYTMVSWHSLMDLTMLRATHRLVERWDFRDGSLQKLNITEGDIHTLEDTTAYHFRFVDSNANLSAHQKYIESIQISDLAKVPSKLVQLGTLFGSSRLRLRQPGNLALRRDIRRNMTLSNPFLLHVAESISAAMGGTYLAAHLRIGDGAFNERQQENVRRIWWKLLRDALEFGDDRISDMEQHMAIYDIGWKMSMPDPTVPEVSHPSLPPRPTSFNPRHSCRSTFPNLTDSRLTIPLFISTDARDPTNHALIQRFLSTFPCTFFLSDFSPQLAHLDGLRNPYDGLELKSFLLPFIDAIVAGKARYVVGTDGSTFSAYVQDVLWRTYHGWDIVQRG